MHAKKLVLSLLQRILPKRKSSGAPLVFAVGLILAAQFGLIRTAAAEKQPEDGKAATKEAETCLPSREYVATLEYLRDQKYFALTDPQARQIADEVSHGCTGAAARFIQVVELTVSNGVPSREAIAVGKRIALLPQAHADAFKTVFTHAYAGDVLDLPIQTAFGMAGSLTADYPGEVKLAEETFRKLARYCVRSEGLQLPPTQCAAIAVDIARNGAPFKSNLADPFIELFEYAISEEGPQRPHGEAIALAKELTPFGPTVAQTFRDSYRYAIRKDGLGLNRNEALEFARQLTKRSSK